ncbi:hypothetical protein L1D55_09870 [Vibrio sp. Isolate22]|uniref:hypothetical protein n=1 Tax=Vibrio sp. Isolate22 TaxID=2908532 RepID=UPI001EFDE05C|nr:hypothetical protein [Vibrio sp. Isolate22]MCG9692053.1 hypothetical protein [Vibrio sp. Isolate22]
MNHLPLQSILDLQPGDIIFSKGTSKHGRLIGKFANVANAQFSHVSLYLGDGLVFETIGNISKREKRSLKKQSNGTDLKYLLSQSNLKKALISKSPNILDTGGSGIRLLEVSLSGISKNHDICVARAGVSFSQSELFKHCQPLQGVSYSIVGAFIAGYSGNLDRKSFEIFDRHINGESELHKNIAKISLRTLKGARKKSEKAKSKYNLHKLGKGNNRYCSTLAIVTLDEYCKSMFSENHKILSNPSILLTQLAPNDLLSECYQDSGFTTYKISYSALPSSIKQNAV